MEWIRKTYGVPAKRGMRVRYRGCGADEFGTIKSSRGAYLRIRLDGQDWTGSFHPKWGIEYLTATPTNPAPDAKD